ncbi:MAG: DUF4214 domain-containing protein [Huintestinicola sp.]
MKKTKIFSALAAVVMAASCISGMFTVSAEESESDADKIAYLDQLAAEADARNRESVLQYISEYGETVEYTDTDEYSETSEMNEKLAVAASKYRISAGYAHCAYVSKNGNLYTWGRNNCGQLGDGTLKDKKTPVKIMTDVYAVSLGRNTSAAIKTNGDLYLWGENNFCQVGDGTKVNRSQPVKVLSDVVAVDVGTYVVSAIKKNGDMYIWGQCDGVSAATQPVRYRGNIKDVSNGETHSGYVTTDGDLYVWGNNLYGQVGNGTVTTSAVTSPTKIQSDILDVELGKDVSAAIGKTGILYTWGRNYDGILGDGTTSDRYVPTAILTGITSVSLGGDHNACVTSKGDMYMWGSNMDGCISSDSANLVKTPSKIMSYVSAVSLGYHFTSIINTSEVVYTWGWNGLGQLGNGTSTSSSVPVKIIDEADTVVVPDPIDETAVNNFVERLYTKLLGRASDPTGKANHVASLKAGTSAADVVKNFVLSTELKNKKLTNREFVKRMYLTMLDRNPDAAGLTRWATALDNGCSYGFVLAGFSTSAEFTNLCKTYGITRGTYVSTENRDKNEKLTAYVARMYTKALGRTFDVNGLNNHTGRYIAGTRDAKGIAHDFIFSTEFQNRKLTNDQFINVMYWTFFNRAPDATGKANWTARMNSGWTREQVFNGFTSSSEFKTLVASFGI